jgi:hypothetical protein
VEGRKDLTAIALRFDEASIPMSYKMHINDFLGQKKNQTEDGQAAGDAGAKAPAER